MTAPTIPDIIHETIASAERSVEELEAELSYLKSKQETALKRLAHAREELVCAQRFKERYYGERISVVLK